MPRKRLQTVVLEGEGCAVCGRGLRSGNGFEVSQAGQSIGIHGKCRAQWRRLPKFEGSGTLERPKTVLKLAQDERNGNKAVSPVYCQADGYSPICDPIDLQRSPCPGHSPASLANHPRSSGGPIPSLADIEEARLRFGRRSAQYIDALKRWAVEGGIAA